MQELHIPGGLVHEATASPRSGRKPALARSIRVRNPRGGGRRQRLVASTAPPSPYYEYGKVWHQEDPAVALRVARRERVLFWNSECCGCGRKILVPKGGLGGPDRLEIRRPPLFRTFMLPKGRRKTLRECQGILYRKIHCRRPQLNSTSKQVIVALIFLFVPWLIP